MDTEVSEIYIGHGRTELGGASSVKAEDGEAWIFSVTLRSFELPLLEQTINVNYDGFAEDVAVGDELVVDGAMAQFEVAEKLGPYASVVARILVYCCHVPILHPGVA
ncbi:unnamed protein product [Urochloa humidicola]